MRGAPGQRHGRIDDVAVHDDLGTRAERAHHAADRRADLAGRVVVDNIIIIMTFQVVIQGLDAIPFMVRHADDVDPMGDEGRGRAGLVCRAKAHEQVNLIFSCIQIQQQVLHITLYAALHTKMVADHENTHKFVLFWFPIYIACFRLLVGGGVLDTPWHPLRGARHYTRYWAGRG